MTIEDLKHIFKIFYGGTQLPHTLISQIRYNRINKILLDYRSHNPIETQLIKDIDTRLKSVHVTLRNGFDLKLSFNGCHYYTLGVTNNEHFTPYSEMKYNESGILKDPATILENVNLKDFFRMMVSANIMDDKYNFKEEIWK